MYWTVKDILEHSLELCDMADSNVISYAEKNRFLNQAWKEVNQKCINKGIKYFHSEVEVGAGFNSLPWDFYQVDKVDNNGVYVDYEIVNNMIKCRSAGTLHYWTKPVTLTFPNRIQEAKLPEIGYIYSFYGNKVVYLEGNTLKSYNLETEEEEFIVEFSEETPYKVIASKGNIYLKFADHQVIINYNGKKLKDFTEASLVVYPNHLDFIEGYTIEVFYSYIDKLLYSENDVIKDLNGKEYCYGSQIRVTQFDGNEAFITDNGEVVWLVEDNVFIEPIDLENQNILGILKADTKTGYGFITSDATNTYIESWIPDTRLDFPSTLMYDYLSYLIAYYITLKIGASTESIGQALQNAEFSFFDSLDNQGYYPTIRNVY